MNSTKKAGDVPTHAEQVATIKREVAAAFDVDPLAIDGTAKPEPLATARHVAMYLSRVLLRGSYPAIARDFNRKGHGSALYAVRVIGDRYQTDALFASKIERLRSDLSSKLNPIHA